jgi:uncharacterized protein (TIGR02271 family)
MYQRNNIKEGMTVRSADGHKLGKVYAVGDTEFHIEKGLFFPKDYACRYSEISDIREGDIILAHGRESLRSLSDEVPYAGTATTSTGLGRGADTRGLSTEARLRTEQVGSSTVGPYNTEGFGPSPIATEGIGTSPRQGLESERGLSGRSGEVSIPVHKEEMDVIKRQVDAGEVRVHKDVLEEEKTVEVPVRRERVRVERRDVKDRPAMHASFQEETVVVPMRAEEAEAQKRTVVDEEVIIRKDEVEEERRVSEPLRHERVDIRSSGDVEGPSRISRGEDEDLNKRR